MTTIAELQLKVDSTQAEKATKVLNDLATATDKAAKARKALNDAQNAGGGGPGGGGGGGGDSDTRGVKNLSEAIDAQTRKLAALTAQRKALNESTLKTENPAEYARLNREIDARTELVRRQGNSLDRLAQQANREQQAQERAAKAAQAAADRETRAIEAREARAARYAAAQARQLESTISGLDRQVKAQLEYNKAVEVLSLQRFQGNLSGAEFDVYVKRAQAKRDDALALQDNTRELERNQRQLDSITATLGKAERAEFQYNRALTTLNESLRLGLVTQVQYDTQLAQHAQKRDLAVVAANGEAAANARLAAQLKNVLSAYNPVIAATDNYTSSAAILRQGLQAGEITVLQYVKALKEQKAALDSVKAAQQGSPEYQAKQYQATLDRLLPLNAQLRDLERQEKLLTQARASGKVTTDQQIRDYERATKALQAERVEIERKMQASTRAGNSAKQDAAALRGLPAQFTDVVVSLQGGQAPLTVLLQQGGQVKDMFGGVGNALKAVGGALFAMITPLTVALAAVTALGYAYYAAESEIVEFNKATAATNNYSGASINSFQALQKSISDVVGTMSLAAEVLTLLQKSGKISVDQFEEIGIAAIKMSRVTGKSISEIVDEFASLGKEPANAILSLDEKYKFLTGSVYLQIAALERQGKTLEATVVAQKALADGVQDMADRILPQIGNFEKAWIAVKDAVKGARDELINWGRESEDPTQRRIDQINKEISLLDRRSQAGFGNAARNARRDSLTFELDGLKQNLVITRQLTDERERKNSLNEKARQSELQLSRDSETIVNQNISQVKRYEQAITALQEKQRNAAATAKNAGKIVDPDVIKRGEEALTALQKKLKEAQEQAARSAKGGTTPLDTTSIQDVKSNLNVIISEYDGYYKKVTALGKANVVSSAATTASQIAILKAEATAVGEEYDKQISEINKLAARKGNNAAQNISIANQLTRAEDQRTKFMQDNAAKQEALEIEAKALIDKKARSVRAYVDALNDQIEAERRAGERAVKSVSGSDSENALNDKLSANDDKYVADQKKLADQLAEGAINAEEYREKLDALTDAYDKMSNVIKDNADAIKEANEDWQAGASRGFKQYIEEGQNAAKMMEGFVKDSLDSMTDALATFVLTGKMDFRSLASSIISDLAKIAIRMAASQALSALFGAYSGYAGGTGTMSGFSENLTLQEKGGAWSSGTQFFAKGGAFTNGIVDGATSFGMSGGGVGVMGEAGPEAIVPLARSADGSLGVRLVGGTGESTGGGVNVYITITGDGEVETSTDNSGFSQFGKELGDFVDKRYRVLVARDLKDGGAIKSSMKNS